MKISPFFTALIIVTLTLSACGSETGASNESNTPKDPSGLTASQLENGIGPVTSLVLEEIDQELAKKGEGIFTVKCSACHKLDKRYVGPALGTVLSRRTPAYVMNMMLNSDEMVKKHPEAKKMLAKFMTQMPNQNLNETDARAILEYLRTVQTSVPQ